MAAQGGALVVRIDYVTLGANKDGWAQDNISGVAIIGGVERPVRAITRYQASAVDQVMFQESNHRRVTQLVQALTYWLARISEFRCHRFCSTGRFPAQQGAAAT